MAGPAVIVAGLGFNSRATPLALAQALRAAQEAAGGVPVQALACARAKAQDPVLQAFALAQALPLRPADVGGVATPSQSPRVLALYGTGSLAEAAALAAAGPGARLLARRTPSPCATATAAIAIADTAVALALG